METIINLAAFNVFMLCGIVVVLLAIKSTAKLNEILGAQNARDQAREDKLINCGEHLTQ